MEVIQEKKKERRLSSTFSIFMAFTVLPHPYNYIHVLVHLTVCCSFYLLFVSVCLVNGRLIKLSAKWQTVQTLIRLLRLEQSDLGSL